MALAAGTVAAIGAGGMGEVYRARDTGLDRFVTVKVLPQHLSSQPSGKRYHIAQTTPGSRLQGIIGGSVAKTTLTGTAVGATTGASVGAAVVGLVIGLHRHHRELIYETV
jgi:serine/threonine protein kinase